MLTNSYSKKLNLVNARNFWIKWNKNTHTELWKKRRMGCQKVLQSVKSFKNATTPDRTLWKGAPISQNCNPCPQKASFCDMVWRRVCIHSRWRVVPAVRLGCGDFLVLLLHHLSLLLLHLAASLS
jgi:hypothetical protein